MNKLNFFIISIYLNISVIQLKKTIQKKIFEKNFKLKENKKFDIYKYFLLPIKERNYYK